MVAGGAHPVLPDLVRAGDGGLAGGDRRILIERHVSVPWLRTGLREASVDQLYDEIPAAPDRCQIYRAIILTSTGIDSFKAAVSQGISDSLLREEIEGKVRLYTAWADSFRYGENRLIEDVGHVTLHLDRPDVVHQAIRDVLDRLLPVVGRRVSPPRAVRSSSVLSVHDRADLARRSAPRGCWRVRGLHQQTGMAEYRSAGQSERLDATTRRRRSLRIITFTLWDSRDSIRAFAGEDIDQAVFYPEDDNFLIERDLSVRHYEVVA